MRSSIAILSLALLSFAGASAHDAGSFDDGLYFRAESGAPCRSRFGVTVAESYCDTGIKAAARPRVSGAGSFANCSSETAVDLLDGDQSPIHFLASGDIMVEERKPKVGYKKDGRFETYNIHLPAIGAHMTEMERDVTIQRDANHNIIRVTSRMYSANVGKAGLDKENPITWVARYSYPPPAHHCQIDRLETDLLARAPGQMVAQYDSALCANVLRIVGKRNAGDVISRHDLVQQIQGAIHDSSVELRENESGKTLQYSENVAAQVPIVIRACRASGLPIDVSPRYDLGTPGAKKTTAGPASGSSL